MGHTLGSVQSDLLTSRPLTGPTWKRIFGEVFRGRSAAAEIKTTLLAISKKGENWPEIWGCLGAIRSLERERHVSLPYLIDVCGTGGDGRRTFNISTVASFVIAGAGGRVAKHGNRAVSSRSGSSDLMEALGIRIDVPFDIMQNALRTVGLGYFHAPLYHPSFARVQTVRRELGIRTLFNLLGPLVNPVVLPFQVIGISRKEWLGPLAEVLKRLKRKRAAVVRAQDGLDELSTCEVSDILYVEGDRIRKAALNPRKMGFSPAKTADYEGGDVRVNLKIALQILENRLKGPKQEIVLLNSGFALQILGLADSLEEGIERSRWSIRSGRALGVLEGLRRLTRGKRSK